MSLSRLRFIVFISTLYLWGAPAFAQPPAQVVGRVVAEETGQPVPDARVGLEGTPHTAVASADGGFAFFRVAPGRYTLVVERDGFQTVRAGIEVTPGAGHPIDVRLPFALTVQEDVTVVGRTVGDLGLGGEASTASRLPLRPIDIPASVDNPRQHGHGRAGISEGERRGRTNGRCGVGRASDRAVVLFDAWVHHVAGGDAARWHLAGSQPDGDAAPEHVQP